MLTTLLTTFLLLSTLKPSFTWNLQSYGFKNHYYISSLAVFRQRTFLTLPRSSCFNKNISNPTLIELPWSGENANVIPRTRVWLLNIKKQTWGQCRQLQDAISVDVEAKKGKLWVLDKGNTFCDGKLVVFNLFFNYEVGVSVLKGVEKSSLAVLVVDPAAHAEKVYVGGLEGQIIVVSTDTMKWKRVKLEGGLFLTDSMAISKNSGTLFITSTTTEDLFSLNLKELGTALEKQKNSTMISMNVTHHGQKLGPSAGMATDFKNGLIYYLKRDYAIVRWDTKKPLQAENHRVLYQSYEHFPYVPHLFTGPQMGIWAVVNPLPPKSCDSNGTDKTVVSGDTPEVTARVVKLLRFNQKNNNT